MKKFSLITCLLLITFFIQCRKSKDENKPAPDLQKNLLAYFRLDGEFKDSTKNMQDVTYGGLLHFAKNRWGYQNRAISFAGGMFVFQVDGLHANPITISLWVKPKDLNSEGYLVFSQEEAFSVYQSKSKLGLIINNPDTGSALADIGTDWMHFAGTYDGRDIKTYINGKLAKTFNHPGTPDVTYSVRVGTTFLPEWIGILDDVRFYNRVLTEEEIKILAGQ